MLFLLLLYLGFFFGRMMESIKNFKKYAKVALPLYRVTDF